MTKRIAVLGTGSVGMKHIEALHQLGCTPIAVPIRPDRVANLRAMGYMAVRTLHDAVSQGAEGAVIATDTKRHPVDCRMALNLGLHVLVEKPIAATSLEAEDLPLIAKSKNLRLAVAFCLRFDPGLKEIPLHLPDLGTPLAINIECRSFLPDWRPTRDYRSSYSARRDEGGVLLDLIHEIDYSLWLFGLPRSVFGMMRNTGILQIEAEEVVQATWQAPNGAFVSIGLDYLSRSRQRHITVQGDIGRLEFDFLSGQFSIKRSDSTNVERQFPRDPKRLYAEQMADFIHSIDFADAPSLLPTGADALIAQIVCDAIRQSALSGQVVTITL